MHHTSLNEKKELLVLNIKRLGALVVAFSGGVDSAFLLAVATDVLKGKVVAVTAGSPIHPVREKEAAIAFAKNLGVEHILLKSREMEHPEFLANNKNRCYICKKILFDDLLKIASDAKISHVAHGANIDDLKEFRPGNTAAKEAGIIAPLVDAGLKKKDVRLLSKEMNLNTWDKPSMSCLATRIPYETLITKKALYMVEQAEDLISSIGFTTCRVRHHGETARIEVKPEEIIKITEEKVRMKIVEKFTRIGFSHIAVDLKGYVSHPALSS